MLRIEAYDVSADVGRSNGTEPAIEIRERTSGVYARAVSHDESTTHTAAHGDMPAPVSSEPSPQGQGLKVSPPAVLPSLSPFFNFK